MMQPLLAELIDIPETVGDADFVVNTSAATDLVNYVVTDDLRERFGEALTLVGHGVTSGRSQAAFLHGSFGSGKPHFMAVLREILRHNPQARAKTGLTEVVATADRWLSGKKILCLSFHMLNSESIEQALLSGYEKQILELHPDAPVPAVHRSDEMLDSAARLRAEIGDEKFFALLSRGSSGLSGAVGRGWDAETYDEAAGQRPGTESRDKLIGALIRTIFQGAAHSTRYLDLDTGLEVITRHAKGLGYDAIVLLLDELILWMSSFISNHERVTTEGVKLNKLLESADAARPLPIVSFVARQRNLEEFLGPTVGGTERQALADVERSVQGRFKQLVLPDTNLPEIVEKRILRPRSAATEATIDAAFAVMRGKPGVWDVLLDGAQYGEAGIGSTGETFRALYPFSPALVATLVALSQALQRERTAIRLMVELLSARRDSLRVNDLIGVASLFEPLVLNGALPEQPTLRANFRTARETYRGKMRPLLLAQHGITEAQAAGNAAFGQDDMLIRTLLLAALVPEVPALQGLTSGKLHALNFGSIRTPFTGGESKQVLQRLRKMARDLGELRLSDAADPVATIHLSDVDYDRLLDRVPDVETSGPALQRLVRELVCGELGLGVDGMHPELTYPRDWRGRRHQIQIRFANVSDSVNVPTTALEYDGDGWRVVIDFPFDTMNSEGRQHDQARIRALRRGLHTVFWTPRHLSAEMFERVAQLARIGYLLGSGAGGDRLATVVPDWSPADRTRGAQWLTQRRAALTDSLRGALKQAYGAAKPQPEDVVDDGLPVLHTLAEGLPLGELIGGTLKQAFDHLTGRLLAWLYPGTPHLPDDERQLSRSDLNKVLKYARHAADEVDHSAVVDRTDQSALRRICNPLKLGELHEHRYVLNGHTCWWSGHLVARAAEQGQTDRLTVSALRGALDRPDAHGFDRDLQNLILAVVAEEQQLTWWRHGGPVPVPQIQAVADDLELYRAELPDEDMWQRTAQRALALLGARIPPYRSPKNLAASARSLASMLPGAARHTAELRDELARHADVLALDSGTGRLATAVRMAELMRRLRDETGEPSVLFRLLANDDLGGRDLDVAAKAVASAAQVTAALRSRSDLLRTLAARAVSDDTAAQDILAALRTAVGHDEQVQPLVPALEEAYTQTLALLSGTPTPPLPSPPVPGPVGTPAAATGGAITVSVPGTTAPQDLEVTSEQDWGEVDREVRTALAAGRTVRVRWEAR
jgi:hypothetical protein